MISGIGNDASYYSSMFGSPLASNSMNGSSAASGSTSLAQAEQQLFAGIDTNADGSISQSEFTGFLNKTAAAYGNTADQTQAANALFAKISGGGNSISLSQFQADAGDLVSQLQSEIAAGSGSTGTSTGSSAVSSLLGQLARAAQALVSGSAASIATSSNSNTFSNSSNTRASQHHHHPGREVGNSLISQFMQQYQAAGATSTPAVSTVSASV